MEKIDRAIRNLREMDALAAMDSPVHRLHPLAKLATTILYIAVTVSFPRYDLTGLAVMMLYPAALFALSGVSVRSCFYKLRFVLPLVCAVGLFNPLLDRAPIAVIGDLAVSGGVISMVTLVMKGVFCLTASFLLAATTSIDAVCAALRKLRVPELPVTLILLTFRYVGLMMEEVTVMTEAYHLRAPGQKGIRFSAWGSFLGQLLLRSRDRAEELFGSMRLRGFCGEFSYAEARRAKAADWLFFAVCAGLFVLFRRYNVAMVLGGIFV